MIHSFQKGNPSNQPAIGFSFHFIVSASILRTKAKKLFQLVFLTIVTNNGLHSYNKLVIVLLALVLIVKDCTEGLVYGYHDPMIVDTGNFLIEVFPRFSGFIILVSMFNNSKRQIFKPM